MSKSISYHNKFKRNYKKRILNNQKLFLQMKERIELFIEDRTNPILRDHQLSGTRKDGRSFWITGDIRIIYIEFEDYYLFLDIGSHN